MESNKWYVLEMHGGGLLTVCLPEPPNGKQLLCRQEHEAPNVIGLSIAADSYAVIKSYDTQELAMAFIAGLELGHQRLRDRENQLNKLYRSKRRQNDF